MSAEKQVLVLNATYEPLGIVPAKRAVALVLAEKVDVLEEYNIPFRGAHFEMMTPSVIKLRYMVHRPFRALVPLSRKNLFARDEGLCQFTHCNRKAENIDHVHPRSKGGTNTWDNVVASCERCNSKKANKTLDQLGWSLKKKPVMPPPSVWLEAGPNTPAEWLPYIPRATR